MMKNQDICNYLSQKFGDLIKQINIEFFAKYIEAMDGELYFYYNGRFSFTLYKDIVFSENENLVIIPSRYFPFGIDVTNGKVYTNELIKSLGLNEEDFKNDQFIEGIATSAEKLYFNIVTFVNDGLLNFAYDAFTEKYSNTIKKYSEVESSDIMTIGKIYDCEPDYIVYLNNYIYNGMLTKGYYLKPMEFNDNWEVPVFSPPEDGFYFVFIEGKTLYMSLDSSDRFHRIGLIEYMQDDIRPYADLYIDLLELLNQYNEISIESEKEEE